MQPTPQQPPQLEVITVAAEDELTALVKESKADGVLDPDEVVSMWQATVSYLKLNPRHEKIAGMQQQLEAPTTMPQMATELQLTSPKGPSVASPR